MPLAATELVGQPIFCARVGPRRGSATLRRAPAIPFGPVGGPQSSRRRRPPLPLPLGIALPRGRHHCTVDCKHGEPWTPRLGRGLSAAASCGQGSTKDLRTAFGCPRLPRRRGAYLSWSLGPREPHPCRLGGPLLRPEGGAARVPWRRVRGGPQGVRAGSREHGCSSGPGGAVRPFRRGGALRRAGRPACLVGRAGARR